MEITSTDLRKLALHINHCCEQKEWQKLRTLDLKIRQVLEHLHLNPEKAKRMQRDIITLRTQHSIAVDRCEVEKERIGRTLAKLQSEREGLEGYYQVERSGA
ncbi:hypothetical protein [Vibrio agarivorans]|jgi:hypothetical protein|uniref:DUF3135 domain-containing protein n=1 Tax=Vibrio agarivorans TaxID=153622 RepID=A0ABT7XVW6_9VIBR|nr:hypothetical protein [Vibrio agarivorans]MDN2479916.1 hypothetical protein [Vibrio agarivorans]MDN3662115.1 hypothetical protein [Vibrio agarivorans]